MNGRRRFPLHTATYLTPEQGRGVAAAAEHDNMPVATWLRQLIIAELRRREARTQLEQAS